MIRQGNGVYCMGDSLRGAMGKNKAKYDAHKAADESEAAIPYDSSGGGEQKGDPATASSAPANASDSYEGGGPMVDGGNAASMVKMI